MKREELKELGLTTEQIDEVMRLHGKTVSDLRNEISTRDETIKGLNSKLDEAEKNIGKKEPEKDPELVKALEKIAEMEADNIRKDIKAYALEKGFSGEHADKVLSVFANNVENAKSALDSLATFISEKESAASKAMEEKIASGSTNPGGSTGGNAPKKSEAEVIAENIGKTLSGKNDTAKSVLDNYL